MKRVQVGDLVRLNGGVAYYKVSNVSSDSVALNKDSTRYSLDNVGEVIRPAKRRTLTKQQACEWHEAQEGWFIRYDCDGYYVGCAGYSTADHPTYTKAVIALRKKMGVKS